jgi:hypothetical protein
MPKSVSDTLAWILFLALTVAGLAASAALLWIVS